MIKYRLILVIHSNEWHGIAKALKHTVSQIIMAATEVFITLWHLAYLFYTTGDLGDHSVSLLGNSRFNHQIKKKLGTGNVNKSQPV